MFPLCMSPVNVVAIGFSYSTWKLMFWVCDIQKCCCLETYFELSEAVIRRCSAKKVFLKISQVSQENTCFGVLFRTATVLKKYSNIGVFPVKSGKFLRTSILKNIYEWLLLNSVKHQWGKFYYRYSEVQMFRCSVQVFCKKRCS